MDNTFLAILFRMKNISRWGLMYSTQAENLMQHTAEVAFTAHFLAVVGNRYFGKNYNPDRLAAHALFHDAPEVFTGDMPTPIKYHSPEMRRIYGEIERLASGRLLGRLPEELRGVYSAYLGGASLTEEEKKLLKIADKLCAYIKCESELSAGNMEFRQAQQSIKKELDGMKSEELRYFMDKCAGAFSMSLDELGGL